MAGKLTYSQTTRLVRAVPKPWRTPIGILLLVGVVFWLIYTQQSIAGPTASYTPNQVVGVVDGDTIDVYVQGQVARVRLIGIDTPETVDPRKPVQCFGTQASSKTRQLLDGQTVTLKADPTQDDTDKYGRLLRYVYLSDGTMVNQYLVAHGFAFEYTYKVPYQYQEVFQNAEANARAKNFGLWSPDTCDGKVK